MNKILCKVEDGDAKILNDSIVEVEACREFYQSSIRSVETTPIAMKAILDYYMETLKVHKSLWQRLLVKYVGEDVVAEKYMILRFDPVKCVIFQLNIEGCALCKE